MRGRTIILDVSGTLETADNAMCLIICLTARVHRPGRVCVIVNIRRKVKSRTHALLAYHFNFAGVITGDLFNQV